MRKVIIFLSSALLFLTAALIFKVHAAEFNVTIDRTYTVESNATMQVVETHRVTNQSSNLLISKSNEETFQVPMVGDNDEALKKSVESVVITVDGQKLTYSTVYNDNFAELSVAYPKELRKGQSLDFKLEYTNFGLVEKSGALFDVYAPGFAENFKFEQDLTKVSYSTKFKIPESLPEQNFVIPKPLSVEQKAGFREYTFSQNTLIGKTIWIQFGKNQFYNFKITQEAPATDDRNTGYLNEYRVILPRDFEEGEIAQKVYFEKIDPLPFQVILDKDDNMVGYFKVPSHEATTITLEGYASVATLDTDVDSTNSGETTQFSMEMLNNLTTQAEFWEVTAPQIQELALELKGSKTNVYEIVEATYQNIVDTIDYSEVKRFGINERQGALKTLQGGAAVCMEYSDLFLTLSRAQGIPARAVFGYGYDSRLPANEQEAHQWVEVFIPGLDKWISVDVTWGEAGPALIGGDMNHFYTHAASIHPNDPPMVERVSYGDNIELLPPKFNFSAVETLPDIAGLMSQTDLLGTYPQVERLEIGEQLNGIIRSIGNLFSDDSSQGRGQLLILGGGGITIIAVVLLLMFFVSSLRARRQMV
ncbi:MAG: transglutaminase family protein [Candidatus Dojkabacteria bacterium]